MITTIKNTDSEQKARITELVASNERLRLDNDGLRLLCASLKAQRRELVEFSGHLLVLLEGAAAVFEALSVDGLPAHELKDAVDSARRVLDSLHDEPINT